MPRKGKEPAGLRRWRLAHRKKKRHHVKVVSVARRRRYYGKKRGGRKKAGIPIVQTVTLLYPTVQAVRNSGFTEGALREAIYNTTGVSVLAGQGGPPHDPKKGIVMGVILLAESTIGRKVANKVGANKLIRAIIPGVRLM